MNYIKKYTVKNFYSIRNEVTVDLSAGDYTAEHHAYRVFSDNNNAEKYGKLKVFYGSNASGKTSLLRALVHTAYLASNKSDHTAPAFKNIYSSEEESFVEIDLKCDGVDFRYKMIFESKENQIVGINNEILTRNDTNPIELINREKLIFKNLDGDDIQGLLFDKVPKYRSLLIESLTRDESYEGLVNFFSNLFYLSNIDGTFTVKFDSEGFGNLIVANAFFNQESAVDSFRNKITLAEKKEFQKFVLPFLQGLDIDIVGGDSVIEFDKDKKSVEYDFFTKHSIDSTKLLDFNLESSGTKMLFSILYDIYYAWKKGSVLVIDELDSILHPMLVPAINILAATNNVQLLYTTHNIYNLKYLYNDEIFLIEKDQKHNTTVRDAKLHPGYENFAVLYEENQLGGLPELSNLNFVMGQ